MANNGINKSIILGRVGKDVEMHHAANGNAIASFSVATGESWTDKNSGQKQEITDWHNITIFGKLAEIAGQYVKKGDQIYLEGKSKTEKYIDNNGVEKYSTKVVLDSFTGVMQMLGGKKEGQQDQNQQQNNNQGQQQNNGYSQQQQPKYKTIGAGGPQNPNNQNHQNQPNPRQHNQQQASTQQQNNQGDFEADDFDGIPF